MNFKDIRIGQVVTYLPLHADGKASHPDCERGIVTSKSMTTEGRTTVFVRYGAQPNSKATSPELLVDG